MEWHWTKCLHELVFLDMTDYLISRVYKFVYLCTRMQKGSCMGKKVYKNRIRVVLAEKMITNTYLAKQLGVSKMTISRWCTNATQPSAPQLIEISRILQCDMKDLYEPYE